MPELAMYFHSRIITCGRIGGALALALACIATACDDSASPAPPPGPNDGGVTLGDGGSLAPAGECVIPTKGHYALGGAVGETVLYLLGDEWDAEIGRVRVGGSDITLKHIASGHQGLLGLGGGVIYSIDPKPDAQGIVQATQLEVFPGGDEFDGFAQRQDQSFLLVRSNSVLCGLNGELSDNGVVAIAPYTVVTGAIGSCSTNTGGTGFSVDVIANDGSRSAFVTSERSGAGAATQLIATAPFQGILKGLGRDGYTVSERAIYTASKSGITKVRDTKLCVNEVSSTMNGKLISSLRSVE